MAKGQQGPRAWQTLRKKITLWRGIAIVVVLLGVAGLASARVMASRADDSIVTTNTSDPVSMNKFMPCAASGAGEWISLSGDMHIVSHTWPDGNGGFDFRIHFNAQGLSGVGQTTGTIYQASGVVTEVGDTTAAGTSTFTYTNIWNLISQGADPNLHVRQTLQVTVNPDGTLAASEVNDDIDCG